MHFYYYSVDPLAGSWFYAAMTTNEFTAKTAKYFGVSLEKAAEMLKQSTKKNETTAAKGIALKNRVESGNYTPYVTR